MGFANDIKFAFENSGYWFGTSWGTDTDSLIRIFRDEVRSKDHYDQVQKKYKILYGSALNIDLADACLVRLSEILSGSRIITVDRDFQVYRRNGREAIPLLTPPQD